MGVSNDYSKEEMKWRPALAKFPKLSPIYESGEFRFQFATYANGTECEVFKGEDENGFFERFTLIPIQVFEYTSKGYLKRNGNLPPELVDAIYSKHPDLRLEALDGCN